MSGKMVINLILLIVVLPSCERKDSNYCHQMGRDSGLLPMQTIGDISNDSIDFWLTVTDTVLYFEPIMYQIDDYETFKRLVNCNIDEVDFNFKEYTLLIGYFFDHSGPLRIIEQEVRLICEYNDQRVYYDVIAQNENVVGGLFLIQHNAIIPKLPEGLKASKIVVVDDLNHNSN